MRLFGLIGYPLTHSFSKNYFSEKFKQEKITDCDYENFQLDNITQLSKILAEHPELEGINVTIPYKESVLQFLDEKDEIVKQIGACNCIQIKKQKLTGFNTDVFGFEKSLESKLQSHHTHALLLGTGGAAKAVEFVLRKKNISYQYVSRKSSANILSYDEVTGDVIKKNTLVINTTPVGMYPHVDEGEKQGAIIQNGYDMLVYQAEESWRIWNSKD
jgi:shikimate dehydrogenase